MDSDVFTTKELIKEYIRWINQDLSFQHIDQEIQTFPLIYSEPKGSFFIAKDREKVIGCIGMKDLGNGICEMKRLYVKDEYKGQGIGGELIKTIIEEAKSKGYRKMRLDTLCKMVQAISLYKRYGFYEIAQYVNNPIEGAVFLEKNLESEET